MTWRFYVIQYEFSQGKTVEGLETVHLFSAALIFSNYLGCLAYRDNSPWYRCFLVRQLLQMAGDLLGDAAGIDRDERSG